MDLNIPIMSTKRHSTSISHTMQVMPSETSRRVPFLWESVAGVRKEPPESSDEEVEIFTPRPPPGRWHPDNYPTKPNAETRKDSRSSSSEEDDDDVFLDAMDNLSLSESISGGTRSSPSFIMDRFLPAANALATASATSNAPKPVKLRAREHRSQDELKEPQRLRHFNQVEFTASSGASSSRSCGIMLFFPWSLKHGICGLSKRPVSCQTIRCTSINNGEMNWEVDDDKEEVGKKKRETSLGWGLPFLDSSRVRRRAEEGGDNKKGGKADGGVAVKEMGRGMLGMPQLKPPSDSWLQRSCNKIRE